MRKLLGSSLESCLIPRKSSAISVESKSFHRAGEIEKVGIFKLVPNGITWYGSVSGREGLFEFYIVVIISGFN